MIISRDIRGSLIKYPFKAKVTKLGDDKHLCKMCSHILVF